MKNKSKHTETSVEKVHFYAFKPNGKFKPKNKLFTTASELLKSKNVVKACASMRKDDYFAGRTNMIGLCMGLLSREMNKRGIPLHDCYFFGSIDGVKDIETTYGLNVKGINGMSL